MLCQSRLESHAQLCTRHDTVHATMQHRPIEHVRQQHSWDCGLACALMVLRSFGINDVSLSDLHAQCATKRFEPISPTAQCQAGTLPRGRLRPLLLILFTMICSYCAVYGPLIWLTSWPNVAAMYHFSPSPSEPIQSLQQKGSMPGIWPWIVRVSIAYLVLPQLLVSV